jgi:hypothetical protein
MSEADNHPTFVETPKHRLGAYLQVFDLPFRFVRSFEDDRPNYGAIYCPKICAALPKTWIQIMVLGPTLLSLELHAN